MAKVRRFGGLVGGTAGFAGTVIQVTHPEWFGNHTWITPLAIGLVLFSIFLYMAQHRWFQRLVLGIEDRREVPELPPASLATASASPVLTVSPEISPNIAPVITASPVIGGSTQRIEQHFHGMFPAPLDQPQERAMPREEEALPQLEMVPAIPILLYRDERGYWDLAPDYPVEGLEKVCVVWVINPPGKQGQTVTKTDPLGAHLEFSGTQHEIPMGDIERAHWLQSSANRLTIDAGQKRALVLGYLRGDKWICNPNPWDRPLTGSFRTLQYDHMHRPLRDERALDFDYPIEVQVSLITTAGTTVLSRRFRLQRAASIFSVMEIDNES